MKLANAAAALPALALLALGITGCGSNSPSVGQAAHTAPSSARSASAPTSKARPRPRLSTLPAVTDPGTPGAQWRVAASVGGVAAAWIAARSGVTLLRFDQRLVRLVLHAGTTEPEGGGWPHGSAIVGRERHTVIAAFNGGFKLSYGSVGFEAGARVAVPLARGLASIVTYIDGTTQIGAWGEGVPSPGRRIESALADLHLLVDGGAAAGNVETCATACWGATLGGGVDVARSALGITGTGALVWAAGESLSPAGLAAALIGAGVQRAVELDINPEWVAGYLYVHRAGGPVAVPVVPGQAGIPGALLAPYSRDFFSAVAK